MATSSFTKSFVLDSKKAVDSFTKIISTPANSVAVDRSLTTSEKEKLGEIKLRKILFERRYEAGKNILKEFFNEL